MRKGAALLFMRQHLFLNYVSRKIFMKFEFLRAKNILPGGWLKKQLETQLNGLHGHLDEIWPDVYDSKWLGGSHDGWERLPYFLDGYIPLVYLLRNEEKIAKAEKNVHALLKTQAQDGCFYPKGYENINGDIWSLFLILKALTVFADCSGDEDRIFQAVYRCLRFLDSYIDRKPPYEWANLRWHECLVSILWVYKRKKENWLIWLAKRLKVLGANIDVAIDLWRETDSRWRFETHVVNIAMALKSEVLYCEITGEKSHMLAERMLKILFDFHGTAYGHFTGDECLSGNSPVQGSELCGIVEAMYSYEWLTAITGKAKWGDLLEKLAFNALPAAISDDMWTHQYDQQVNQIACIKFENKVFRTNSEESNLFGLEPNFGCCTANFGQGFPKFALSSYMTSRDRLVVISPMPAKIMLDNGVNVRCESEYPFRNEVRFTADTNIDILLRIPNGAEIECSELYTKKNGFANISLPKSKTVKIVFKIYPRQTERPNHRKCVYYGNLLFALPISFKKKMLEYERDGVERKYPYCDYTFTPIGEWRYAFADKTFSIEECDYELPIDREHPPLKIKTKFAPVKWGCEKNHAFVAATKAGTKRVGNDIELSMVPYGATYLRITEMACICKKDN